MSEKTHIFRPEHMSHQNPVVHTNLFSVRVDDGTIPGIELNYQGFFDGRGKPAQGVVGRHNHVETEFFLTTKPNKHGYGLDESMFKQFGKHGVRYVESNVFHYGTGQGTWLSLKTSPGFPISGTSDKKYSLQLDLGNGTKMVAGVCPPKIKGDIEYLAAATEELALWRPEILPKRGVYVGLIRE